MRALPSRTDGTSTPAPQTEGSTQATLMHRAIQRQMLDAMLACPCWHSPCDVGLSVEAQSSRDARQSADNYSCALSVQSLQGKNCKAAWWKSLGCPPQHALLRESIAKTDAGREEQQQSESVIRHRARAYDKYTPKGAQSAPSITVTGLRGSAVFPLSPQSIWWVARSQARPALGPVVSGPRLRLHELKVMVL